MENAIVTEDLCRERRSKFDERCARDIRDIATQSQRLKTLEEMSITMSQILENMAEKTEQHEQRLKVLEQRRITLLNKWETALIGNLSGLVVGYLISLFI